MGREKRGEERETEGGVRGEGLRGGERERKGKKEGDGKGVGRERDRERRFIVSHTRS